MNEILILIPLPFSFAKYDARRFIAETLEFLKAISQYVCRMSTERYLYDDWYLKCQMPKLWLQLIWAFAHPNGPPPANAAIYNFFNCFYTKIQKYKQYPPLTYDVFFWKELKNDIATLAKEWQCDSDQNFVAADAAVKQAMITVMRTKRDFFAAMAMMYV